MTSPYLASQFIFSNPVFAAPIVMEAESEMRFYDKIWGTTGDPIGPFDWMIKLSEYCLGSIDIVMHSLMGSEAQTAGFSIVCWALCIKMLQYPFQETLKKY